MRREAECLIGATKGIATKTPTTPPNAILDAILEVSPAKTHFGSFFVVS